MDIVLIAYINKNLGDDLFIDMICRRYPQHTFHVLSSKSMTDYLSKIPNLRVHSYNRLFRSINGRLVGWSGRNYLMEWLIEKYKYCICIGGSIFMQSDNWKTVVKEREELSKRALKYFIISANFGPYTDYEYFDSYRKWFEKLSDVCVRDSYSYRLFAKLHTVRYAPDAIFNYMTKKSIVKKSSQRTLVISCIDYSWREGQEKASLYEHYMAHIASFYMDYGWEVILLALCQQEGDTDAANRISKLIESKESNNFKSYSYDGDYKKVTELLSTADFVIASRFHATVIPLSLEIPVLPVPYSNKTRNMLKDIGYDGFIWELDDGDIPLEEIKRTQNYRFKIHGANTMAQKQFAAVDQLLAKK